MHLRPALDTLLELPACGEVAFDGLNFRLLALKEAVLISPPTPQKPPTPVKPLTSEAEEPLLQEPSSSSSVPAIFQQGRQLECGDRQNKVLAFALKSNRTECGAANDAEIGGSHASSQARVSVTEEL